MSNKSAGSTHNKTISSLSLENSELSVAWVTIWMLELIIVPRELCGMRLVGVNVGLMPHLHVCPMSYLKLCECPLICSIFQLI